MAATAQMLRRLVGLAGLLAIASALPEWQTQAAGSQPPSLTTPLTFTRPIAIAVGNHGQVYVADDGANRIVELTAAGQVIRTWGSQGTGLSSFDAPVGIGVDHRGRVYVADATNARVEEFSPAGIFRRQWSTPRFTPSGLAYDGAFLPEFRLRLAVTANGRVAVLAPIRHGPGITIELWSYSSPGRAIFHTSLRVHTPIGSSRHMEAPWALAADRQGNLYPVFQTGHLSPRSSEPTSFFIQQFSPAGRFRWEWGGPLLDTATATPEGASLPGGGRFCAPLGLAIDAHEQLWLTDACNDRVEEVSSAGRVLHRWGRPGCGPGKFSRPAGIAVGPGGNIYITDSDNLTVQKLNPATNTFVIWGACP